MSDTKETGDKKLAASGSRKTLSLKRTVESGHVRQNFSHGRSKSVLVEKKRKRTIAPAKGKEPEKEAPAPVAKAPEPKPEPAPKPEATPTDDQAGRSGMVLRTLTEEEKVARAQALTEAKAREQHEREEAEERARQRAETDARRKAERDEAERRAREEAERLEREDEARQRAEQEAARRLEEEEAQRKAAELEKQKSAAEAGRATATPAIKPRRPREDEQRKTTPGRGDRRRREGKLTISRALDDSERQRSLASMRRRREKEKGNAPAPGDQGKIAREVTVPEMITVQELANRMAERSVDVIKLLMQQGIMAKINDAIDADTAQLVAEELGHSVKRVAESDVEEGLIGEEDTADDMAPRAPVVTVMGHVDHGKTSLLDALRQTDVVAGEAGGITQHIGAYQVQVPSGDRVTFLDTPGHAAFTAMRARGAKVTDLVILVVAANDGVMPQTVEAIDHAKAAEVPIIVAINKMDLPEADPTRVLNELLQHEVVPESLGGDVLCVEVSATKRTGLDTLVESILLQSELLDAKANPNRSAEGIVIEARLERGRGPVATLLVQRGTLAIGDIIVAGAQWGRVRALIDDHGANVAKAGPSVPVEILGLDGAPEAGDRFAVVENEARAREVADYRQRKQRESQIAPAARSLEQMLSDLKSAEGQQEVPLVVKADVQGSAEAINQAIEKLGTEEVVGRVLHAGVGGITESDVTLARASGAVILGFNVRANAQAREAAQQAGVEIRYYSVIYDLVDDVKAAMAGLLSPAIKETFLGNAEILEVFNISKVGRVAGCRVTEGNVKRGAKVRLIRDSVVIHEGTLSTLKRFKDEVREVNAGQECGMAFENYQDLKVGDVIECFDVEEVARTLD